MIYITTSLDNSIHVLIVRVDIITLFSRAIYLLFFVFSLISFVEFQAFESLLCAPDAISQLSFKLFDVDQSGKVLYGKRYVQVKHINYDIVYVKNEVMDNAAYCIRSNFQMTLFTKISKLRAFLKIKNCN